MWPVCRGLWSKTSRWILYNKACSNEDAALPRPGEKCILALTAVTPVPHSEAGQGRILSRVSAFIRTHDSPSVPDP